MLILFWVRLVRSQQPPAQNLAKNLLTDAIEGKDLKESARERGKEAGKQSLNLGTKRVIEQVQGRKTAPKASPKAVKRPRSQSGGPKKKKPRKTQKGGKHKRKRLRKKVEAKSGSKKQRKAIGVVFPRAMTQKQRRSLPPKDIFG